VKRTFLSHANVTTSRPRSTNLKGEGVLIPSMRKKTTFDCDVYQSMSSVVSHQCFARDRRRA